MCEKNSPVFAKHWKRCTQKKVSSFFRPHGVECLRTHAQTDGQVENIMPSAAKNSLKVFAGSFVCDIRPDSKGNLWSIYYIWVSTLTSVQNAHRLHVCTRVVVRFKVNFATKPRYIELLLTRLFTYFHIFDDAGQITRREQHVVHY